MVGRTRCKGDTTINNTEYRNHCKRTRGKFEDIRLDRLNAAIGLGEAGELQGVVKKEVFHGHPQDAYKILDESGDLLYYLDWLLDTYGWTIENAMNGNVAKLKERYPEGFSSERSMNRIEE